MPLGDFFGTAPGINKYKSLPVGMTEDGFYCYWYMPFEKSALLELTNDGDRQRTVTFTITHTPVSRPIKELGRFHVKWHRDAFLPAEPERRAIDWTMLKTKGRGRYCGVMLHVWNPKDMWWGEGDEKFFIDGEKFPSTFGTGSEDYFGYAWCDPTLFTNCYHNQTISMGNRGHVSVNRWHISDNVPFQTSFEGAIEKYFPNDWPTLYAATAYWYQAAGQTDPYEEEPVDRRRRYYIKPARVKGAIEGETLNVLRCTGGQVGTPNVWAKNRSAWSGETNLWWYNTKPGDMLILALPVEKTGKYKVLAQFTKGYDYATVQLYLDDNKLGGPIDLYDPIGRYSDSPHNCGDVAPSGALDMGTYELDDGKHDLRIDIIGANDKAEKEYKVGLDYLLLEEIK